MSKPNILLIEDHRGIAQALSQALSAEYVVDTAETGKSAIYKTDTSDYQLVILDLALPDMHGLQVCQQLRERGVQVPILILTAEARVLTKIHLLDAGANDYLTKPFSLGELKARLRCLLRTVKPTDHAVRPIEVGNLTLDPRTFKVTRQGVDINLRRKEFALLQCLMKNAGAVVSRSSLSETVWPETEALWTNTVDVHIKYLRDKVDRPFDEPLIKTMHGVGYKIEAQNFN